jgi:hypothetical protein
VVMLIQAVMLMLWEVKKKKKKMMMIEGYTFLIRLAVTLSLIFRRCYWTERAIAGAAVSQRIDGVVMTKTVIQY